MHISLRNVVVAVALLLVGWSPSRTDLAAAYVPRWESTYDPAVTGGSQTAVTGRPLADGSTMVVGDDNGSTTAVRFSVTGTVLSKATFLPPATVWAYQISPFGEVFVKGNGYVMKYDGISGAAAWPVAQAFTSGGPVVPAFTLDPAGHPVIVWDEGTTRHVRKYNHVDGAVLWTNSVTIPSGVASQALTTDSAGNVIVVSRIGGGTYDFYTTKLSSVDGGALWSSTYDRSTSDQPLLVAVDHSDSIFVAGTTFGTGGDIAVVKYNSAGAEQWRAMTAGPASSSDVPTAVTVDANDNLYIAGTYLNGSFTDLQFMKYSPTGTRTLYVTRTGTREDKVLSIAADGAGDLHYAGYTNGPINTGTDLIAGKINGNTGVFTWTKQYDRTTAQNDAGAAVAISPTGDALIAATTTASTNTTDFTFVRYSNSNGTQIAMTHVDGNGAAPYAGRVMTIGAGQVYAGGDFSVQKFDAATGAGSLVRNNNLYTLADLAFSGAGELYELSTLFSDYSLLKYNAAGGTSWSRTYNGGSTDRPVAMTLDGSGNPIIAGASFSAANGWAIVTVKYDAAGTQQWVNTFNGTTSAGLDEPVAILTDAAGNVFVAGTATNTTTDLVVVKINGVTGAQVWNRPIDSSADTAFAMALDASGNPVITGRFGTGTNADFGVAKINNATGAIVWNTPIITAVGDEPHAIAIDGAGDVLLFGTTNITASTGDLFLVKLNAAGAQQWTATYDGAVGIDNGVAVKITSTNEIVVLGTVMKDAPRLEDLAILRYTALGAIASGPAFYDSGRADIASALGLISDDPVVVGRNGDRFLVIRYNESLGIVTRSLPPAYCNVPYSATVEALNGTPPYTWSVVSGLLPSGLLLDPSTGTISGTAGIGGAPFTSGIRVTDAVSAFVERNFRIESFPGAPYVPMTAIPNPACGSTTLSVAGPWSSYSWQPNGETTSTITPAFTQPTLFGAWLGNGSCVARAARQVDVMNPLSAVTINVAGSTTLCNVATGGTATVTATGGGTATHQWGYRTATGGPIADLTGRTGTSYVITTSDFPGAGTYYLVARTTPSCGSPMTSNEVSLLITTYAAPTALTAAATANNEITVSWAASSGGGVHHYNVYRSDSCTGSFTKIAEAAGTTFTDTTVVAGGTYAYKVTAAGSAANVCESGYSNCQTAVAYGNCAVAPSFSGSSFRTPGACKIGLSWPSGTSNCPLAKGIVYNVYRSTVSNFIPAPANRIADCVTGLSPGVFWDDTNVVPGTTYYYVVRAEDSTTGNGGPCNGGNEDTNLNRGSAVAEPGYASTLHYRDDFDAIRPANAAAYWQEIVDSGPATDQLGLNSCYVTYKPENVTYKFGGVGTCDTPSYLSNSRVRLELGGDGIANPAINGIVLPASGTMRLRFRHHYSFETGFDGASLYYRTTAVPTRTLVGETSSATAPYLVKSLYTGSPSSSGHRAWTGSTTDFTEVVVNIPDALHGQTIWFSWRFTSDGVSNYVGYFLDDVLIETVVPLACDFAGPLQAFTATSKDGVNKLEWINPASVKYGTTIIRASYLLGGISTDVLVGELAGTPGAYATFNHAGTNGTTYRYTARVKTTDELVGPRSITKGMPDVLSKKKWGFNTGATAMTPPGVGPDAIFAVSNDRMLYSLKRGASGGDWSNGWQPFQMNGASQARPSVVKMNINRINGTPNVVFVSSQDGYVYAIDADTGVGLWETQIGEMVQGSPSVAFREYGIGLTNVDLVIAGTRNSSSPSGVYALNTQGGGIAWSYTGGGTYPIGVIGGQVSIDYPTRRVYFASRAASSAPNGNHTLWCISFDDTSATRVWSVPIGDIDGSPVVRNGTLYVGTNSGTLYAVNPNDGTVLASYATADGPIKNFPFPNSDGRVYFSTTSQVWSVIDSLTPPRTLTRGWQYPVLSPSTPVFANNSLYVGSSNGRLRQFSSLTSGTPTVVETYLGLDVVGMPVGTIGFDPQNNLAYVGTAEGVIYAVSAQ